LHLEEDNSWGNNLLRSKGLGRIILGAALTLTLTLSPSQAQTQADRRASPSGDENLVQGWMGQRYGKSSGVSKTPAMKVIDLRDEHFLMALLSPLRLFEHPPRFTSPLTIVSPPSAPLSIPSKPDNLADRTLTQARGYLGSPYRRGGSLQSGHSTDCSGFVQFIYKKSNIDLPRSSSEQARAGVIVAHSLDFAMMLPGDLLFFGHRGRHIGHVGIYLGDGKMIHASGRRFGVIITDLRQPFYEGGFVVARRLFEQQCPQLVSIRKPLPVPPFGK
jgi:hypothetical protein